MPDLYERLAATEPARLRDSSSMPGRETFTRVVETADDDRLASWALASCALPAQ